MSCATIYRIGLLILVTIVVAFGNPVSANAQGVMVRPMIIEVSGSPGQTLNIPLELRGTTATPPHTMDLAIHELVQMGDGQWEAVRPGGVEVDLAKHPSATEWLTLGDTAPAVEPMETTTVTASLEIPHDARGYHFAAIMVRSRADPDGEGIQLRMAFLIPIIVEIKGRPARQNVRLSDVAMEFIKEDWSDFPQELAAERQPIRTTIAHMQVVNEGRTYSRIRGELRVERQSGDRWRLVTRLDIRERGIIPNAELRLGGDLGRRLPSGTYRLRGELWVDGRRVAPVEKIVEFEGDPDVNTLALDTELILTPRMVEMDIVAGATRTTAVSIENPGSSPIDVQIATDTPRALQGMVMGQMRGDALSAAPWTEVRPAEFTVRPGRSQNVRVISRIPPEDLAHPHYYADLSIRGAYPDGQSAGETHSMVNLVNKAGLVERKGIIENFAVAEGDEPSHYITQLRFVNVGRAHVERSARGHLLDGQGQEVSSFVLSGESGPLLPLGKRTFSGEANFSGVEPGHYALRMTVEVGEGATTSEQQLVLIEMEEREDADGEMGPVAVVTVVPDSEGGPADFELPR